MKKISRKLYSLFMIIVMLIPYMSSSIQVLAEESGDESLIGALQVDVNIPNTTPYSGADFNMNINLSGQSFGEAEEFINPVVTIPFDSTNKLKVEVQNSSEYTYSWEGNNLVIRYSTFMAGSTRSISLKLKFDEGISIPTEIFSGDVIFSADNGVTASAIIPETHPININKPTYMLVIDETATHLPYEKHNGKIELTRENYIGGLNVEGASLRVDFPSDIELSSVKFGSDEIIDQVQTDVNGNKFVLLDIADYSVTNNAYNKHVLEFQYSYPMLSVGDLPEGETSKDYEIKATFTGTRYNGEDVYEEGTIKETIELSSGPGKLSKSADKKEIEKKKDQTVSYDINYIPAAITRNVVIIDDPYKDIEYFEIFNYQNIEWHSTKNIESTMYYQTNLNNSWTKANDASVSGMIDVSSLGLSTNEIVTKIKWELSVNGNSLIPINSGEIKFSITGKTLESIKDDKYSIKDNLINTATINGEYLSDLGVYEVINEEQDAVVKLIPEIIGAFPGFSGWEHPFYNKEGRSQDVYEYGDSFSFAINPANIPPGNDVIKDAVFYMTVPKSFEINPTDVVVQGYEDGRLITKPTVEIIENDSFNLIKVNYHTDVEPTGYTDLYGIRIKNIETNSLLQNREFVDVYFGSEDSNQKYIAGVGYVNGIQGMTPGNYTMSKWITVSFVKSVQFNSDNKVSDYNQDYSSVININNQPDGSDVNYRFTVENIGTTKTDYMELIAMLPYVDDTVTTNDINKNSTLVGNLQGITLGSESSDSDLSNYDFYFSKDATPEKNTQDLKKAGSLGYISETNWEIWDGTSGLSSDVKAIKIVKKDGLEISQKIQLNLNYHVPEKINDIDSLWTSFGYGGYYKDAAGNKNNISIAEPRKSGLMVGDDPIKSISGHTWKDENNNGIREEGELLLPNYPVYLVNKANDIVGETTSDVNGYYEFDGLFGTEYRVIVENISENPELELTKNVYYEDKNVNDFTALSNEDPVYLFAPWLNDKKGKLSVSTVDLSDEDILNLENIDAGYRDLRPASAITISGNIWEDVEIDGKKDDIENVYSGIATLNLFKKQDDNTFQLIKTTKSDEKGFYEFSDYDLMSGEYVIGLKDMPSHYKRTVSGVDMKFDDVDAGTPIGIIDSYITNSFVVTAGEDSKNWDLGLIAMVDVYVTKKWDDKDVLSRRPDSINIQFKKNDVNYNQDGTSDPYVITPDESGVWEQLEIKDLEKYSIKDNKVIENKYTVDEVNVPKNYTSKLDDISELNEDNVYRYQITNTYKNSSSGGGSGITPSNPEDKPDKPNNNPGGQNTDSGSKPEESGNNSGKPGNNSSNLGSSSNNTNSVNGTNNINNSTHSNTKENLPKTGESDEANLYVIGLLMITISIMSLGRRNKKESY